MNNGMLLALPSGYANPKRKKTKEEDDDKLYTPTPSEAFSMPPLLGLDSLIPPGQMEGAARQYSRGLMPRGMGYGPMPMGMMQGYSPMAMTGAPQMPMYGNMSQVNISYTAADGSTYHIGFSTSPENKAKALDGALGYLKSIMLGEGKGYAGGYAGGKGVSGAGKRK